MIGRRPRVTALIAALVGSGAWFNAQSPTPTTPNGYEATIRRTSYGIPHITARDFGSLGFGEGYALAQDHLCTLADQVVLARGERAKFFGPGERNAHVERDIAVKALRVAELGAEDVKNATNERREWLAGYAAGYNSYLSETGVDAIPGWCRGAAWVQRITAQDVAARTRLASMSLANVPASWIATAAPPAPGSAVVRTEMPEPHEALSNGWAIGSERSETKRGLLLANPHYPWVGANRFWEKHLTIPGRLDVYGVSLVGSPGVGIGFNRHVAWTHTVSAGVRWTGYALTLAPDTATSYIYDGQPRPMTRRDVQIDVRQADGSLARVSRSVYFSHHGPIVNFPGLPWTATRAVALRDANLENNEGFETYSALARATTLEDVKRAHALGGISFVNTIVATADGRAFYIDAASAPHLSDATIKWWKTQVDIPGGVKTANARGLILLDGSRSSFEWVNDPRARDPGVVPTVLAPQLERRDYVFNANDSHWMSHARVPLSGFSPVHGDEDSARSLRTRMNARLLDDTSADGPSGRDGRFSIDELWAAVFSNGSMSADLLRASVVDRCGATDTVLIREQRVPLTEACRVLKAWNGRFDLDSRGAVLWREFITQIPATESVRLFAAPFSAADPIGTPRGLSPAEGGKDLALESLGRAVQILERARLPLDTPLGQVQFARRGERRIPVHGGLGDAEGILNFVAYSPNRTTTEPDTPTTGLVSGSRLLRAEGYPINGGSSFVMVVAFTDAGPRARAVLTYGQSGDPHSPHFSDQTELFSKKGWREILFSEQQIRADEALKTTVVAGRRESPF